MLHRLGDFISFAAYVTACVLDTSFIFDTAAKNIGHVDDAVLHRPNNV